MSIFLSLIGYAIGLVVTYFVIRLAVCHGINSSDLFALGTEVNLRENISKAINQSQVKKED